MTLPTDAPYLIDETRNSVVLRRYVPSSMELAFAYWTEPRHVTQWWDPSGEPLRECSINLTVGGQLRFIAANPAVPPFVGRYLEINAPTRLVFEALGATGTVSIRPDGAGSEVEVEIRAPNAEALKAMIDAGVANGTAQTLDNLRAYAKLPSTKGSPGN